jgi:hypothetical protein
MHAGKFQASASMHACAVCPSGTYAAGMSSRECAQCATNADSFEGSSTCLCMPGFEVVAGDCVRVCVHVCMKESLEARACACLRVCMCVNAIENISFKQPLPQTKHTNTRRCVHRLRGGKVQKCPRIICLSQLRGGQVRERARVCVLHLVRGKCGGTRRRYYLCLRCRYMCTMCVTVCVCVCVQCRYVVRLNRIIITVK